MQFSSHDWQKQMQIRPFHVTSGRESDDTRCTLKLNQSINESGKQRTAAAKPPFSKANWRSLMIQKKRDSRARLWNANHKQMTQHLKKVAEMEDAETTYKRTVKQFLMATQSRCSLRSRLLARNATLIEMEKQLDK